MSAGSGPQLSRHQSSTDGGQVKHASSTTSACDDTVRSACVTKTTHSAFMARSTAKLDVDAWLDELYGKEFLDDLQEGVLVRKDFIMKKEASQWTCSSTPCRAVSQGFLQDAKLNAQCHRTLQHGEA